MCIADAFGEWDNWIEIYNQGTADVELTGFTLTDDPAGNPNKWAFPTGISIPALGYLLVWADSQPTQYRGFHPTPINSYYEPHASFSLKASGGSIGLFDPNGVQVGPTITYGAATFGHSQVWSGGVAVDCAAPTPRAANTCH